MGLSSGGNGIVISLCNHPVEALLCDYDIDKADMKHAHTQWLTDNIIRPLLAKKSCDKLDAIRVIIEGRASRTGSEKYNQNLSQLRANNVYQYLDTRVRGCGINICTFATGESLSNYDDHTEFAIDRAVRIQINEPQQIQRTTLPPPPKFPLPAFKTFKLRVVAGESVSYGKHGFGIKAEVLHIQIWDVVASTMASYTYTAKGRSVSLGISTPVGVELSFKGKWSEFKAPGNMAADSFSGPARLDGSIGLTIVKPLLSTDKDFHFGGFADTKWWTAPSFNFSIKELDTGASAELSAGISLYEPDIAGSFNYVKDSMITGYTGD